MRFPEGQGYSVQGIARPLLFFQPSEIKAGKRSHFATSALVVVYNKAGSRFTIRTMLSLMGGCVQMKCGLVLSEKRVLKNFAIAGRFLS
jgi:hypothetical protein